MSIESSRSEKEISDAEWEDLRIRAKYYTDFIEAQAAGASRSYNHILNNLAGALIHVQWDLSQSLPQKDPALYQSAIEAITDIERYLKLLEDFPEFKEKELQRGGGYFPEMMNQLAGVVTFIDAYEVKLKGSSPR